MKKEKHILGRNWVLCVSGLMSLIIIISALVCFVGGKLREKPIMEEEVETAFYSITICGEMTEEQFRELKLASYRIEDIKTHGKIIFNLDEVLGERYTESYHIVWNDGSTVATKYYWDEFKKGQVTNQHGGYMKINGLWYSPENIIIYDDIEPMKNAIEKEKVAREKERESKKKRKR